MRYKNQIRDVYSNKKGNGKEQGLDQKYDNWVKFMYNIGFLYRSKNTVNHAVVVVLRYKTQIRDG